MQFFYKIKLQIIIQTEVSEGEWMKYMNELSISEMKLRKNLP